MRVVLMLRQRHYVIHIRPNVLGRSEQVRRSFFPDK